jgi:hypothetical protein
MIATPPPPSFLAAAQASQPHNQVTKCSSPRHLTALWLVVERTYRPSPRSFVTISVGSRSLQQHRQNARNRYNRAYPPSGRLAQYCRRRGPSIMASPALNFITFNQDYSCLAVGMWSSSYLAAAFSIALLHHDAVGLTTRRYLKRLPNLPHRPILSHL